MSSVLGLSIGESFAELVAFRDGANVPILKTRWYLPRKSLSDGLKEALRTVEEIDAEGGRLLIASDSVTRILEKSQGRSPAVIVTPGFETWLEAQQLVQAPAFAHRAKRERLPTEEDFIFTVGGRIGSDGEEVTPLVREDLEFLAAKLELLKVKDVAINLLNAHVNPDHEQQASSLLRDKGLRVFCSHQNSGTQAARWRATIENAFAESSILEEKEQIELALKAATGTWETEIWTPAGLAPFAQYSAATLRHGLRHALDRASSGDPITTLHCGLDHFHILGAQKATLLALSPTALIHHGPWPLPSLASDATGFAPGPMALGKSQQLAMLDILYVRDRLQEVEGLTALLSEKSRPRILESLFTISKRPAVPGQADQRPPDANEIAVDLEKTFVERCAINLAEADTDRIVHLTGPLGASVLPLLSLRRPDLKISSTPIMGWIEGSAAAGRAFDGKQVTK